VEGKSPKKALRPLWNKRDGETEIPARELLSLNSANLTRSYAIVAFFLHDLALSSHVYGTITRVLDLEHVCKIHKLTIIMVA
jgi:hypothetical protein